MEATKEKAPLPLTDKQENVFQEIKNVPGGHLRPHRKTGSQSLCWKLMDNQHRPIRVYTDGIIRAIIEKGFLEKSGSIIIPKESR